MILLGFRLSPRNVLFEHNSLSSRSVQQKMCHKYLFILSIHSLVCVKHQCELLSSLLKNCVEVLEQKIVAGSKFAHYVFVW